MGTLIETLASKKKPVAVQAPTPAMILPILEKAHEGACGDGCACGESDGAGCCGG